jgi:hypothetical protein
LRRRKCTSIAINEITRNNRCLTTGWTIGVRPRQGQRIFLLAPASRPALRPTQPPVEWVPGVLSRGVKRGRGVMLTTHPHLVPRLSMSRSYTSFPPMCLHGMWRDRFPFFSSNNRPLINTDIKIGNSML